MFLEISRIKIKLLSIFAIPLLAMTVFMGQANADAVIVTSRAPGTLGHTSVISQDKDGRWYYFYWGHRISYERQVPDKYMENIDTFNEWMLQQKNEDNKLKKITSHYAYGIYVKGDFTKATEYYSNKIKNYSPYTYFLGLQLCSVVSRKALNKGILPDGKPFTKQLKYILKDYIPLYDVFPDNYRKLIERSFRGTEYEGPADWGDIKNPKK